MLSFVCMGILLAGGYIANEWSNYLETKEICEERRRQKNNKEYKNNHDSYNDCMSQPEEKPVTKPRAEKKDFTSYEAWIHELYFWTDEDVFKKVHRMNGDHFNIQTADEGRRFIAKYESINKRNCLYGKCF